MSGVRRCGDGASRPRVLDLFCGAGGAAVGYHRAGFDVVGIDIAPQPRFPFAFIQADALDPPVRLEDFDLIHASPPCQAYSRATAWRGSRGDHPDLIAATRDVLAATGVPFIIENVQEARFHLEHPVMLCGSMFGLRVRRHRYFEAPAIPLVMLPPCEHRFTDYAFDHGTKQTEREYADAMECEWMTVHEAREAIPPAYTEWLGTQMLAALEPEAMNYLGEGRISEQKTTEGAEGGNARGGQQATACGGGSPPLPSIAGPSADELEVALGTLGDAVAMDERLERGVRMTNPARRPMRRR